MDLTHTVVAVLVLTALTSAIVFGLGLEKPWLQPWAIVRACAQLAVLSLVLRGVISDVGWTLAFLVVMGVAAWFTVRSRLRGSLAWDPRWTALTLLVAGSVPLLVVFGVRALPADGRYLLALGGIVVGGAMTATTLMGRALTESITATADQIEGWLALGATPRQAARDACRRAASTALMPGTDQTRTTGLVTLPGAFVGAVFGGASIAEAAMFQVVVLAALLATGALAVLMGTVGYGAPRTLPVRG